MICGSNYLLNVAPSTIYRTSFTDIAQQLFFRSSSAVRRRATRMTQRGAILMEQ